MKRANPEYTLLEWMLVDAYTKAAQWEKGMIHEFFALLQNPFDKVNPPRFTQSSLFRKNVDKESGIIWSASNKLVQLSSLVLQCWEQKSRNQSMAVGMSPAYSI
eukprot:scaffold87662_cov67-Attheya_sp.AAC.1